MTTQAIGAPIRAPMESRNWRRRRGGSQSAPRRHARTDEFGPRHGAGGSTNEAPAETERQTGGKGRATVEFLGFTLYWARTRKGRWGMFCKTRRASLRRIIQSVYGRCRCHRHLPVKVQHHALTDHGPDLGHITTSLVHGGAGWRKSLVRIWRGPGVGDCPGYSTAGFLVGPRSSLTSSLPHRDLETVDALRAAEA